MKRHNAMLSRSHHHPWKSVSTLSSRDKGLKTAGHQPAPEPLSKRNQHNISIHNEDQQEQVTMSEEEIHVPMVRIGVLSRSTSTNTTSAQAGLETMVPPSRIQSCRVSDLSIETIRQSLREMEAQLVVAQNTVAVETKAEYDLHENAAGSSNSTRMNHPERQDVVPTLSSKQKEDDEDKENACSSDQDIKRVLDDLQWAEFVTFRNPKPTHKRSRSQAGKAAMTINSMGRNCHPERQGRSWWRKHPIVSTNTTSNGQY